MAAGIDSIPDDIEALQAALVVERGERLAEAARAAEAELAVARAKASEDQALIAQQKLRIAKLERQTLWPAVRAFSAADRAVGAQLRRAGDPGQ